MDTANNHLDIGAYLLGELPGDQAGTAETHLSNCAECREEVTALREIQELLEQVPPELALDGPPEDADLLLQRTLRQVRTEVSAVQGRRRTLVGVAAAVAAAAVLGVGIHLGQTIGNSKPAVALPPPSSYPTAAPTPGARFASATDPTTGARLTLGVQPAAGWIRIDAAVTGIPAGQECQLFVIGRDGSRVLAGSWLVSPQAATAGVTLDGTALIDPANVAAVDVENTSGKQFVRTQL